MPPKSQAKNAAAPELKSNAASSVRSHSKRKKKPPSTTKAQAILAQRDALIAKGLNPDTVGLACKGLFGCDKK
jgi:hypothetical protein